MTKELIISSTSLERRLAILEDDQVSEIFIERSKSKGILGNICKGRVTKVLPGMQAAFVDIGLERNAFLYVSDFFEDYDEYEAVFDDEVAASPPAEVEDASRRRRGRRGRGRSRAADDDAAAASSNGPAAPVQPKRPPERLENLSALPRKTIGDSGSILPVSLAPINSKQERIAERLTQAAASPSSRVHILPASFETLVSIPRELLEAAETPPEERPPETEVQLEAADNGWPLPVRRKTKQPREFRVEATKPEETAVGAERERPLNGKAQVTSGPRPRQMTTKVRKRKPVGPRGNARNLINELLKEGQEVLVQISKEPIGKKGARITSHVALPGRYMVYMPTVDHVGVSRRIVSDKERQRLRRIVLENRGPNGKGFIVRTAGENHSESDLLRDIRYLTKLWDDIKAKSERHTAPALIHSEPGIVERIIRDHVSDDFRSIRVDDEQEYENIVEFISRFNPSLVNRVRLHTRNTPIFEEFAVAQEVEKALKEKVWLKNGGYIVINQTEALVAVDVNTGKFVGSTNSLEDTITRTNLDAVKEVVRQIRLRDLGGIIIIDFIDMDERRNRQKVMEALQVELGKDKAPSKILQFNEFGLVAITRKRVKQSLERALCQPCIFCEGTGLTKSVRTICYSIHHEVRKMLKTFGDSQELMIRCHPDVGQALRNGESQVFREIEEMTGKHVTIATDPLLHIEHFSLLET